MSRLWSPRLTLKPTVWPGLRLRSSANSFSGVVGSTPLHGLQYVAGVDLAEADDGAWLEEVPLVARGAWRAGASAERGGSHEGPGTRDCRETARTLSMAGLAHQDLPPDGGFLPP